MALWQMILHLPGTPQRATVFPESAQLDGACFVGWSGTLGTKNTEDTTFHFPVSKNKVACVFTAWLFPDPTKKDNFNPHLGP